MPEKVRRIKSESKKASSWGKRVFFFALPFLVLVGIIYIASFITRDGSPAMPKIENQETAATYCLRENCFLLNPDGVLFKESSKPGGNLVFLIDDKVDRQEQKTGESILKKETLDELIFLKDRIFEDFSIRVSRAEVYDREFKDFEFKTIDGWTIKISVSNNANATLTILGSVLDELGSSRDAIEYIDLRLPTRVYYKLK